MTSTTMMVADSKMTAEYIDRLVRAYPSIRRIWLFGSRANGTATAKSDWDYLVFGDDASAFNALHSDFQFNQAGVDLMFVGPDLDEAAKPWQEPDGYRKKLGLGSAPGGIKWKLLSDTEAQYIVHRDRCAGSIETVPVALRAELVYRRD